MNAQQVQTKIDEFTAQQVWMHNYEVYPGVWSIKRRKSNASLYDSPVKLQEKALLWQEMGITHGIVEQLSRTHKRILDVACGEGLYSFIASNHAEHILGVDLDTLRIEKAQYVKAVSNKTNISFQEMNIYSEEFNNLTSFDLAFCLGLLHRVPDPFNLINQIASKADTILFEWITSPAILDQDTPWGYHAPGGLYEWMNATQNFEDPAIARQSKAGGGMQRVAYWLMSYGAIEVLCARAGLNNFLRLSRLPHYPDVSSTPKELSRRVALVASRKPFTLFERESREGLCERTLTHYAITDKK